MRILQIILITTSISLFSGCLNRNNSTSENTEASEVKTVDFGSPFAPVLEKAIRECIAYINEREVNVSLTEYNYLVMPYEEKGECYISISSEPCYFRNSVLGYGYLDDYTIVVNNSDIDCLSELMDTNQLIIFIDSIPGFPEYREMPPMEYDPFGIRVKIVSPDSLETIYKGML